MTRPDGPPRRALRSNFPRGSYLWAVRNAQWRALGIPEEDCEKPKIAIVNSSSGLAACFSHLDAIAAVAKDAIRAAGAVPFEIRTAAPSDFVIGAGGRGGYILATRDLVTNDIEVAVEGAQLDGMLCLASCDKTVPGQLMAAARLNIPTLLVACGYQPSGHYDGEHVDIEDIFVGAMHAQGKPVGLICIAPAMAPRLIGKGVQCTIGRDDDPAADAIRAMGGEHRTCAVDRFTIDEKNNVISTPAYMLAGRISDAAAGITRLVTEIVRRM